MVESRCHVAFTPSAGHALSQIVAQAQCADDVLCLSDNFSFGPIARSSQDRVEWVEQNLGLAGWRHVVEETDASLAAATMTAKPVVAWVSRRDTYSYAGFLCWLARAGSGSIMLADATVLRNGNHRDVIGEFDRAEPMSLGQRVRCQQRWQELQAENAPLRVIQDDDLISTPIDYFDADLLQLATEHWQRMTQIIGNMFEMYAKAGTYQACDGVLASRLVSLTRSGHLEWRGDLADLAHCELRTTVPLQRS